MLAYSKMKGYGKKGSNRFWLNRPKIAVLSRFILTKRISKKILFWVGEKKISKIFLCVKNSKLFSDVRQMISV